MNKLFSVLPNILVKGFVDGVYAGRKQKYERAERFYRVRDNKKEQQE